MLKLLKNIFNEIKESLCDISINPTDPQQIAVITLYGTIFENASSCIILFENKRFTSIPILLRNMLEAYIDLIIAIKDRNYCFSMALNFLKQKQKFFNNALKNPQNKLSPQQIKKYNENLTITNIDIQKLQEDGYKAVKIDEKFTRAGKSELYEKFYNILCQEAHNNIGVLEKRHIIMNKDEIEKFVLFRKITSEEEIFNIHYITWFLLLSFREVQSFFDLWESIHTERIAELADNFYALESEYYAKNSIKE